jgi:hypothetical protein
LTAVAAIALVAGRAAAACPGDCNGDGMVSVAELILGVRISLGQSDLVACPAFDVTPDGELRIEELIAAVGAALSGCPATPTPTEPVPPPTASDSPTATVTATATEPPTATPSVTPTVPAVSGRWREDPLIVGASTCPTAITEEFAADLASRPPCEQTVEALSDTTVAFEDCSGTTLEGTLERDGTIHIAYPTSSDTTPDGCTVELTVSAVIPAAMSPTSASYTFAVSLSGSCPATDCTMGAEGAWTRLQ